MLLEGSICAHIVAQKVTLQCLTVVHECRFILFFSFHYVDSAGLEEFTFAKSPQIPLYRKQTQQSDSMDDR